MSGVVLRCPNCGTTKAAPGECEACHEAQVRHFCTNHTPGLWLDAPACPRCGARFGEATRPAAAPPPPAPAPTRAAPPRSASPAPPRREPAGGPWGRGRREGSPAIPAEVRGARAEVSAAREALRARLPKLLRGVARVRRAPAPATRLPDEAPATATGPALGGCLSRALFLVMFMIISLVALFLMLGGSLFQMFGVYYY